MMINKNQLACLLLTALISVRIACMVTIIFMRHLFIETVLLKMHLRTRLFHNSLASLYCDQCEVFLR